MSKIFTWSEYRHYCLQLNYPSDGSDEHQVKLTIGFYRAFIQIPLWRSKPWAEWCTDAPRYGISYHNDTFWIHYGADKWYTIDMPWQWEIVRHDLLLPDGSVYHRNKYPVYTLSQKKNHVSWYDVFEKYCQEKNAQVEVAKFVDLIHHTRRGARQSATIRLAGEEREWRWKWFKWLPFPRMIQRTVNCDSDVELGEKVGSWKGGLMGWSCEWRKDESMRAAFNRWYRDWNGV
jgi:hypothetical protein